MHILEASNFWGHEVTFVGAGGRDSTGAYTLKNQVGAFHGDS